MNRGYAGFYNGHYLRSSYEYAYAKFLDFHSKQWGYEDQTFDLGYKKYKPDFFFYDDTGRLEKIVEIKSRNKEAKDNALRALSIIRENYNIKCELISYEELLKLYQQLPFTLNSVITEWIQSKSTTVSKSNFGELNSHYGFEHRSETKRKIGEHTKKIWASNSVAKQKMLAGLRKTGQVQKGKIKTPREIRNCLRCNNEFTVLITSNQRFCGTRCSGKHAMKLASEAYVEKRNIIHNDIKEYVINWSLENEILVLTTPLNKIKTMIQPLLDDIHQNFGVKDIRVISKAVFGEDSGRKELIKFMKKVCNEKIC